MTVTVDTTKTGTSGGTAPTPNGANVVVLQDATNAANQATVAALHNSDNQALPVGTTYGLLTGGVAQLVNPSGNLDRQRATGGDVISSVGIATGTQQLAWPALAGPVTSGAITGSTTAQTITLTAVSGTVNGVAWALVANQALTLEANTVTQETFVITAVNVGAKTVTGVIKNNHSVSASATAFFYDQARSAIIADGSSGQGIAAGGTYLLNKNLNGGNSGWEGERSAAGEMDGASGTGTAIAAEYECNSGGPALVNGMASGLQFDRGRNVLGKGRGTATITAPAGGATSIVVPTPAQVNLLQPGSPIYFVSGNAIQEVAYVSQTYSPGTSPIALQNPVVTGGETTIWFDQFAPGGPGLTGFTPSGIEISEEAIFDPNTGLYYQERAATSDNMALQNVGAKNIALFNGVNFDRQRGNVDVGAVVTLTNAASGGNSSDQTNINGRGTQIGINITAISGVTATLTVTVQGKDPASGQYYTLLTSAGLQATGFTLLTVYPGAPTTANVSAPQVLPRMWRILYTITGTTPQVTATIGASVII